MKILGKGLAGVVLKETPVLARKLYLSAKDQDKEQSVLNYVASLCVRGFEIGCQIPKLHGLENNQLWQIEGKQYRYSSILDLIPGKMVSASLTNKNKEAIGKSLGQVLYTMHTNGQNYRSNFIKKHGSQDEMLRHILQDKAARVIAQNNSNKEIAKETARYLQSHQKNLDRERTLSHLDLHLHNVMTADNNQITGLVDWSGFGLTHPSVVMYQLATTQNIWPYIQKEYQKLGGCLRLDILYAAATIHVTWAPIKHFEVGLEPIKQADQKIANLYAKFKKYQKL